MRPLGRKRLPSLIDTFQYEEGDLASVESLGQWTMTRRTRQLAGLVLSPAGIAGEEIKAIGRSVGRQVEMGEC